MRAELVPDADRQGAGGNIWRLTEDDGTLVPVFTPSDGRPPIYNTALPITVTTPEQALPALLRCQEELKE